MKNSKKMLLVDGWNKSQQDDTFAFPNKTDVNSDSRVLKSPSRDNLFS